MHTGIVIRSAWHANGSHKGALIRPDLDLISWWPILPAPICYNADTLLGTVTGLAEQAKEMAFGMATASSSFRDKSVHLLIALVSLKVR